MLQHAERSPMTVQRRVGLHALHAVNDELKDTRIGLRLPSLKAGGGGGEWDEYGGDDDWGYVEGGYDDYAYQ